MFPKFVKNALLLCLLPATLGSAQQLSPKWEELTAEDFVKALQSSSGVCLLPFGIIEKHGPSGPLGTDLINVRGATLEAVKQQYAIVFPEYYFGQIAEARHQPGTVATVPISNWHFCRQRPMRWRVMAATKC
jgi:creatinine amidohydrolase